MKKIGVSPQIQNSGNRRRRIAMIKRKQLTAIFLTLALAAAPAALLSGCKGDSTSPDSNAASAVSASSDSAAADTKTEIDFGLKENIEDGVILHAWSWSFNTIKDTMA